MALDPGSGAITGSPESSGRNSPIPRQWRNQLGGEEAPIKDKAYRRYAAGVEKTLSLFDTALEEWADYISFLNRLLKSLQARPSSFTSIPSKALVAKRLSQCLNPGLPSGVHQKALEVYGYVFATIGTDGLSRDLPLYLPGLASTLSFASLSVREPYLDLLETYFVELDPRSLRPAMKSIILALLPGLEEETSEDFERTLNLVARFKVAIRPKDSEPLGQHHASGDDFFWQCFFLASITSHSRRAGALAYLVRYLPALGPVGTEGSADDKFSKVNAIVTSPEPGLLVRCFASGLADEQLLIQRGFLDLLVSHLPLNSDVLQERVKPADLELLVKAAVGVVTRRDMSLNRRLWAWLLGPEPTGGDGDHSGDASGPGDQNQAYLSSRTTYFEDFGLQPLTRALLEMIKGASQGSSSERARPYRICLSLMDRWEIGGLVVPEVFMPVIDSVRQFQEQASTKSDFTEVLRSASVFFDGIESGLIYSEIVGLLAQAIGPGDLTSEDRMDKLSLVSFIVSHFNIREEEMITIHAPLTCLAALFMLEESTDRKAKNTLSVIQATALEDRVLGVVVSLLELVPERAFPEISEKNGTRNGAGTVLSLPNVDLLKRIKNFYVHEQGNLEASAPPFNALESGELLLQKAVKYISEDDGDSARAGDIANRVRILSLVLSKTPTSYSFNADRLLSYLNDKLGSGSSLLFPQFSSMVQLATQLRSAKRIDDAQLSELVIPLVRHSWSYLSASEPKYHVETVRCLWQLQTAITSTGRDVEAALSDLLTQTPSKTSHSKYAADNARTFGVLWSHSLQDTPSERRGSRTQSLDPRATPRLAGTDHFHIMLAQPVFLVLDALLDDRTQAYMAVKSWLNSMIGIDRLFLIFAMKMTEMPFLYDVTRGRATEKVDLGQNTFSEDDDLDLCLYYLRTLHNVLRCSGDMSRAVLASKYVSFSEGQVQIRSGAEDDEMTLQEFFVRICMRCVTGEPRSDNEELVERVSQLHRYALTILHQFFLSRYASSLSSLELENVLIDRLSNSISKSDPFVQVLLLDVVYDVLKLHDVAVTETQSIQPLERRPTSTDNSKMGRSSVSLSESRPPPQAMPVPLLKCLQAGLSCPNSQSVLESWVVFLGECISLYPHSIFQVLIPLVETLCQHIGSTFASLRDTFISESRTRGVEGETPESSLIYLLNGLEQVLALAHDQLLAEESHAQMVKSPDQPQSLFGSMVSGVWQSEGPQSRSATANDRLTVHLAFQDAMRICYRIWSWGQGDEPKKQDAASSASFTYTSLRMRNRARRLMEHLFTAEILECLETIIDIWRSSSSSTERSQVFNFMSSLDACRPRHSIPALFNSIYSRTNPTALDPSRKSTMTISLQDYDLVVFLVEYSRSLDDDAMDEIWQDCMIFLKDLLGNPFPHRATLPSLLEFAGILGEKVDNTNFGEQRRMRRELGDLFNRLLAALFTTRPLNFTESPNSTNSTPEKPSRTDSSRRLASAANDGPDGVVSVLAAVAPNLPKILLDPDRVLSAAGTISTNVIGPTLRSKLFPDTVTSNTLQLLHELSRLQNNQKTWKKDVGEAFNDNRFFGTQLGLVKEGWLPLLKQWVFTDKEKIPEIAARISAPTTAGIVFGVGAASARLEADRKTQLNLRRIATLILSAADDAFVAELPVIFDKLVELLSATSTSSPSSTTRADVYMVLRALALKTSPIHLAMSWPVVNAEIHAAISSVVAPDHSAASDMYLNTGVLQACKLLDLLICVAPDDFQLHEWLFITDTIEAVYRSSTYQPVALVDELSEELGNLGVQSSLQSETHVASGPQRRPLLGVSGGGISDDISLERKDELVAKILRPFFGQLSIFAFESTYAMGSLDKEACVDGVLKDLFDEKTMVRAL